MKIHLQDNVEPFFQSVPRVVPIALLPKIKKELNKLVKLQVIKSVDFPTDWCSPIVVVPKYNKEEICLCCDYTKLNTSVKRPVFPVPKVDVALAKLKGARIFSRLDAKAGFHQIKLDTESQYLTTFITLFGRYVYTRLPFGINCAPDYFSKMFSDLFADIENVIVHVDDILIYADFEEQHDKILKMVLERLHKEGVTLNKDKCKFSVREIDFLGHKISERGIEILPERVSAIINFPTPNNKNSLLQFLGTINYIGKLIPNKSKILEPLNALLKDNIEFGWLEPQIQAFNTIKKHVQTASILAHFDPLKNITVQADACSYGLGGALIQEDARKNREIVSYASRTLTECEKRHSQIEKEALALAFAAERFKEYIIGLNVILETDHNPLIQVLQTKPLDELTPRLQRIRMRLMRYNYKVVYVPGKLLVLADFLSRNPLLESNPNDKDLTEEIEAHVNFIISNLPASESLLKRIQSEQECNHVCSMLKQYCQNGWPSKTRLSDGLLPYYQHQDKITFCDG